MITVISCYLLLLLLAEERLHVTQWRSDMRAHMTRHIIDTHAARGQHMGTTAVMNHHPSTLRLPIDSNSQTTNVCGG